jgi:hypothetical protein
MVKSPLSLISLWLTPGFPVMSLDQLKSRDLEKRIKSAIFIYHAGVYLAYSAVLLTGSLMNSRVFYLTAICLYLLIKQE